MIRCAIAFNPKDKLTIPLRAHDADIDKKPGNANLSNSPESLHVEMMSNRYFEVTVRFTAANGGIVSQNPGFRIFEVCLECLRSL